MPWVSFQGLIQHPIGVLNSPNPVVRIDKSIDVWNEGRFKMISALPLLKGLRSLPSQLLERSAQIRKARPTWELLTRLRQQAVKKSFSRFSSFKVTLGQRGPNPDQLDFSPSVQRNVLVLGRSHERREVVSRLDQPFLTLPGGLCPLRQHQAHLRQCV